MEFHHSVPSSVRRWQERGIEIDLLPTAAYSTREPTSRFSVGFCFERQRGVHAVASDRRTDFDRLPGSFVVVAPGIEMFSESLRGGEYLVVRYDRSRMDAIDPMADINRGCNPRLWAAAQSIRAGLIRPNVCVEEIHELAIGYLALATAGPFQDREADQLVARGLELMRDRMVDEAFRVSSVADELGLSPVRFLRGFRRATGVTPVKFMREARVQHARSLMRARGTMALNEVALASGFAHQSHMGEAFQRVLGMSPGQWRRECVRCRTAPSSVA